MIVDFIAAWSTEKSGNNKSQNYLSVNADNFADKLALAKLKLRCQALKNLQKYEFEQRRLLHKQQAEIDRQETEHIRFVKYVNNDELLQGLNKQAMFM